MKNILLLIGGYFLLKNLKTGLGNVVDRNIKIGVPDIAFKGLGWDRVNTELIIPIENTTAIPIPIDAVEGSVYYRGQQVGAFNSATSFTISPRTTTKARLNVPLTIENASTLINLAIESFQLSIDVRGIIQSKGVNFPFSFTISPR